MKNKFLLILITILFFACSKDDTNFNKNQFVVEAFLYAGEPINDIRIKKTFTLSEVDGASEPISDAEVSLFKNGQAFELSHTDSGFYAYTKTDLIVEAGDVFQLEVSYNGQTATAETIVPEATQGLELSEDIVRLPRIMPGGGPGANRAIVMKLAQTFITATWNNPNDALYFMTIESEAETLDPILPEMLANRLGRRFRFVSEPTAENEITFAGAGLETFGKHIVRVYRINAEYAALYENQTQDSRDLNEPPSNVQNALGVFSAFNSQVKYFDVIPE